MASRVSENMTAACPIKYRGNKKIKRT